VTDSDRTDAIAALKRVRAWLESALQADANGQAPGGNDLDASGHRNDAKMARSPVYKAWKLVGQAIEALCAVEGANRSAEDRAAPDDLTCIRETGAPARGHESELRSDLQEIVEAARKDAPAHEDAPSPLALELASQTLGERADATVEAASPSNADKPASALKLSPQHGPQLPTVAVSASANAHAAERARRLADARQRLAHSAELADSECLHDVGKAAVTFVIRERERAQQPTFGSSAPRAKPDLNRLPSTGRSEPRARPMSRATALRKRPKSSSSSRNSAPVLQNAPKAAGCDAS
jgi:hypothetical protein